MASNHAPQPHIARAMGRIAAMILAADVDVRESVSGIEEAIRRRITGRWPDHSVEDVAAAVLGRMGATPAVLKAAHDSIGDEVELTDVLAAMLRSGMAAEDLCWTVVGYESQYHIRLVWMEANRMAPNFPDRAPEDLAGWGWLGLRVALRNFEPARQLRFSTYACYRIKGAIRDGVRDENPVPKRLLTLQRKVAAAEDKLAVEMGRAPKLPEVAEALEETLEPLSRILPRLAPAASIEELTYGLGERSMTIGELVDDTDPLDEVILAARDQAVRDALVALEDDEAEAVRLLIYEGRTMTEVRRMTGLSDRELRRRVARGCEALAQELSAWAPGA